MCGGDYSNVAKGGYWCQCQEDGVLSICQDYAIAQ